MTTDKAERILSALKKRDRHTLKHWKPYDGPAGWDSAVLNAPRKELEEGMDERPEVSNV